MADGKEIKSKRDTALERLKTKHPDGVYDDDEAVFGQMNDDYDDYENQLNEYKEREGTFSKLFTDDPRSAQFLSDWKNGKHPVVALVEMFGDDFVEEMKDPEKQQELAEASKAFAERVAKEKEYDEIYRKNIEETRSAVARMQEEEGLTDEDVDTAMEFLVGIMKDGILGKFTPESIKMALDAVNHDEDVEYARGEGEVAGRNARITERLRKRGKSDGTASLGGRNAGETPRDTPELGALAMADNDDIWTRGGEKRTKYQ